jgi:predicted SprT family Zn-dependent metalloprotease
MPYRCQWCGKEYYKMAESTADNKAKYCCQKCEVEAKAAGK